MEEGRTYAAVEVADEDEELSLTLVFWALVEGAKGDCVAVGVVDGDFAGDCQGLLGGQVVGELEEIKLACVVVRGRAGVLIVAVFVVSVGVRD